MITKRLAAPKLWKIEKKKKKFVISIRPGPHKKELSIPLGIIIRDYLKITENLKETKKLLSKRMVKVNGRVRKDRGFPIGIMDVLEIGDKVYRVVPGRKTLELREVKDKNLKLSKVIGKKNVKGGKIQITLHDGWNILLNTNGRIKPGDSVLIDLNSNKIKEILEMKEGNKAIIIGGRNMGKIGKIEKIKIIRSPRPNMVVLSVDGEKVAVPHYYVFVVGKEKPVVEI